MSEPQEKFTIRLNEKDRPFLDKEGLRLMQEHFEQTRELRKPSLADVVTELLEELRNHRRHADRCPHRSTETCSGEGKQAT